jgi:hypothetical protein
LFSFPHPFFNLFASDVNWLILVRRNHKFYLFYWTIHFSKPTWTVAGCLSIFLKNSFVRRGRPRRLERGFVRLIDLRLEWLLKLWKNEFPKFALERWKGLIAWAIWYFLCLYLSGSNGLNIVVLYSWFGNPLCVVLALLSGLQSIRMNNKWYLYWHFDYWLLSFSSAVEYSAWKDFGSLEMRQLMDLSSLSRSISVKLVSTRIDCLVPQHDALLPIETP